MFKPETRASCFTHKFDSIGFNLIMNIDTEGRVYSKGVKYP